MNPLMQKEVPILCVGGVMKEKILNNLCIAYPEKIYPLPNGYDPEIFRFYSDQECKEIRKARSIPTGARVVISIGTLTIRKNHGFLIRSLSKLSEKEQERVICLIVGGGYRRRRLEKLARDLHFRGKVIFLGDIGREEVARLTCSCGYYGPGELFRGFKQDSPRIPCCRDTGPFFQGPFFCRGKGFEQRHVPRGEGYS